MEGCSGVYQIKNSVNGKRYIGSTVTVPKRLRTHRWALNNERHHCVYLQRAWNKYGEACFKFDLIEEVSSRDDLIDREQVWLDRYSKEQLYNSRLDAVIAGKELTEGTRLAISRANKGRKVSVETRAKMAAAKKGKPQSSEAIKKRSGALKGRSLTEKHRRKISEANKGRTFSVETRKRMSEGSKGHIPWNKGKKGAYSEEARVRMSEGCKGRKLSEETKRKISEKQKGRKLSEEAKAKLRGREISEETRMKLRRFRHSAESKQKISDAAKGRKASEETCRKLSESRMGEKHPNWGKHLSEEIRKKIGDAHRGQKRSEEAIRNMSEAQKGKRLSPAHKRKIGEGLKGHRHTKESIQKMSEAAMGSKNPMYGQPLSAEHKKKLSISVRAGCAKKRATIPQKICPICGDTFGIKPGEKPNRYHKRMTCSPECRVELCREAWRVKRGENLHPPGWEEEP